MDFFLTQRLYKQKGSQKTPIMRESVFDSEDHWTQQE